MLIRKAILEQIKQGDVTLAFRRWKRLSIKAGSQLKTSVGLVCISNVSICSLRSITEEDARNAGYSGREELLGELKRREGDLYRILLSYGGADPRIALRENVDLSQSDLEEIEAQLARYDNASRRGTWTHKVLLLIERYPLQPASNLAEKAGFEKEWLKGNVRKLKNLGLTISHQPGYELSPRGCAYIRHTKKELDRSI